jgi:YhcH/YjgK/YiaL family protein
VIVDHLKNWKKYFTNPVWEAIFAELAAIDEASPETDRKIAGEDIVLKVFSYTTLDPQDEQVQPESHRQYLDIHTSIINIERINWYPVSSLTVAKPYDAVEDEINYARPIAAHAAILMTPGLFALFGPDDAHLPRLHASDRPQQVKKAVVKIPVDISF